MNSMNEWRKACLPDTDVDPRQPCWDKKKRQKNTKNKKRQGSKEFVELKDEERMNRSSILCPQKWIGQGLY